jgi:segregation and condensation protein B
MNEPRLKNILEAVLMAAGHPMSIDQLQMTLFPEGDPPEKVELKESLAELEQDYEGRALELVEVASGYRFQVRQSMEPWVSRLWEEKPARYSRALLETLALVAYRQPITRAEIEDVRGVSVSSSIIKTLQDREWIRVVGHRDVPGRPALFGTTREFLDYFGLKNLDELPTLAELRDIDSINAELDLGVPGMPMAADTDAEEGDQDALADADHAEAPVLSVVGGEDPDAGEEDEDFPARLH